MTEKNNKKRILILSTAYYPFVGGAEVAIKEITDRLGNDFDFDLITAKLKKGLPKIEKVGNVTVYRIGNGNVTWDKILLPFRGFLLVRKLNKRNEYFCMWGMMATFGSGAGYIFNIYRKLTFQKRIPMILTLQEGDSEAHLNFRWLGLIALSWKLALRNTDVLTAISNFLLNRAEKNGYKGESFLVPNGVDVDLFGKEIDENVRVDMKNTLGKKDGEIFLVTTGRLTHKNATDDIISALPKLNKDISLVVIGRGDDGPKLQKLANDLGVAHRVKFLGFVPYTDIPKYFSTCDIFIRPSRSEGFGNSFIEAMAAKLPVIATPVGGIVDFINDKETGVYCSPNNPQSIAKAVNLILEDDSLRNQMVENAYNRVKDRYDWNHVSVQMKEVFDKAL
ncbi:MAG: glycosyl transferase group 1 [Parcubacteria group bacterium Gr01-1014_46]|nr:MAG: glycosyl transferase group 1 [Parcubacteria group bacterium Gr01-1014_46]